MPIVTNQVASFENNLVRAELDWNNSNGQILRFRIYNNSSQDAFMYALLNPPVNGWSEVGVTAVANQITENNLPNNTVKYTKDIEDGEEVWKLYGVEIHCRFPM